MSITTRLIACALAGTAAGAQATVLTFETFGSGGIASYGDRVAGSPQGGSTYGAAGGWTPNVTLDFAAASASPPTLWSSGYGGSASFAWALGHGAFNVPFTLTLTPDAGFGVRLDSLQLATWSSGTYLTEIRIWDAGGSFAAPNLFPQVLTLLPNQRYDYDFGTLAATQGPVAFWLSNLGSVGIDNLQFSQAAVVPEPGAWALMAAGLAAVGAMARRRRLV